ncbi:MAG: FHA domain-containing protein [Verrucomicrobiaceae bacterium]|nr:FHA domain-containing protein [Verrucomicrobiaceae bacterium]
MASLVFTLDDGSTLDVELDTDLLTVGRHEDSMVPLQSPSVSSQHATVRLKDGQYYVQDLGSRNGTRVNGTLVEEALLQNGDQVAFGDIQAMFVGDEPVAEAVAVPAVVVPEPIFIPPAPAVGIPEFSRPPAPVNVVRRPSRRPVTTTRLAGDGCVNALMVIGLFLAAFVIGMALRHYSLTERFLLNDMADAVMKKFGRITIEKPQDSEQ